MLDRTTVGATERGSRPAITNNRDLSVDFVKGALIILVIVGHLLQYVIYRDTDAFWLSPYFKSIYMFHMPLFMAISGYLSSKALLRKSFTRGVSERAMQLLLPMLFWCALVEIAKLAVLSPVTSVTGGLSDFSRELIGTYWFIWAAFTSFLFIKLLAVFNRLSIWIVCASAIAVAFVPVTVSIAPLVRFTYPFFCLGFLLSQANEWPMSIIRPHKYLLMLLLATATCLCFLAWGKETYAYNNLVLIYDAQSAKEVLLMFAGSAAASAVAMLFVIECWRICCSSRVVRFVALELGQSTLLLYLVQGAVFRLMDFIQFGELWDATTRIALAGLLGVGIVVIATSIRWIVRDLGNVWRVVLGSSQLPGLLKARSVTN
ncbi:nodulation factor fucose acetyltransferase NolL [Bradyrhizobium sp. TZ2]